ncbi:MAG: hypothetical protein UY85_C0066G0001, partial [Candidatus Peribacteria bacterium GW2011_GWB1_54_5]
MEYTIVFLALLAGVFLGLLTGWFWFSKGKKISASLQAEINEKEHALSKLENQIVQIKNQAKTAEAEARAQAREILSEAKLQASEMETRLEKM